MTTDHRITSVAELRSVIGAERPEVQAKNIDHIDDFARDFLAACPFIVLSTADSKGSVDASPKGDAPGFVEVVDEKTLLIPDRPGNKLAYGHLNILENPQVGLLCLIPGTPETLRVSGQAELSSDPELLERLAARGRAATLAIQVSVDECFFHCAKAFIRSQLWSSESWPERHRVSFGKIFARRMALDNAAAGAIDDQVNADYRENL